MNIMKKVLIVLLVLMCVATIVYVKPVNAYDVTSVINSMQGNANVDADSVTTFQTLGNTILTFLQIISGITAVVMIAITGFRYIVETPEVKGELKKNMIPIVIGIILVFFAASIAKFFLGMFKG